MARGQNVMDDDQGIRLSGGSVRYRGLEIILMPDRHRGHVETGFRGSDSRLLECATRARIAVVPENGDAPSPRHHVADYLDLLFAELGHLIGHAGRVGARPGETDDQTGTDGVG